MTVPSIAEWLDRYGAAWTAADGMAAAALFTEDAVYCWGPFEQLIGTAAIRERWDRATSDQGQAAFSWDLLGGDRDRCFVHWRTTLRHDAGAGVVLDGVFVLDFDQDGLCSKLQEWWLARPIP